MSGTRRRVLAALLGAVAALSALLVLLVLAAYEVSVGAAVTALVVGLLAVVGLPDVVIRTYLAGETANLPASLYLVGGLLTVGAVGIIAGPLVVALSLKRCTSSPPRTALERPPVEATAPDHR